MRGSAISGEGESEDEGRGFGFAGVGEVIGFSATWVWAVGMGLETTWLRAVAVSSGVKNRASGAPLVVGRVIMGCNPSGDPSIEGVSEGGVEVF
ncbi:hypothetical protein FCV25MIE_15898 [Fagus crenata]